MDHLFKREAILRQICPKILSLSQIIFRQCTLRKRGREGTLRRFPSKVVDGKKLGSILMALQYKQMVIPLYRESQLYLHCLLAHRKPKGMKSNFVE